MGTLKLPVIATRAEGRKRLVGMGSRPKPSPSPSSSRKAVQLGPYQLLRRIAVGGMAELYLARATRIEGFEKLVALKRIHPQRASDPRFVRMFLNEARLAASLDHPNIASVHDIGRENGE